MNKLTVGLDLDDTVFGFSKGYLKRFKKWPNYDWAITRNVTNILIKEKEFWTGLEVIRRPVGFEPKLYCSSRVNPKSWTKKAIEINDLPNSPLYQIPGYHIPKSRYIKGRISVFIDDSPHQFKALNESGSMLRIYSLDYNEIEEVYYLAKELGIFNDFNLYYDNR